MIQTLSPGAQLHLSFSEKIQSSQWYKDANSNSLYLISNGSCPLISENVVAECVKQPDGSWRYAVRGYPACIDAYPCKDLPLFPPSGNEFTRILAQRAVNRFLVDYQEKVKSLLN